MHKVLSYAFPNRYNQHPVEKAFDKMTCYHYYFFLWLFLSKIPVFWRVLGFIFMTAPTDFFCNTGTEEAENLVKDQCPCDNPVFDKSVFSKTLQSKFGLYCDKEWYLTVLQSMLFVGSLIGSFIFGFLSDRIGRLKAFMVTCLILCVVGIINSQMTNLYVYTVLRVIEGIGLGGSIVTSFVLLVEYCGPRNREAIVALYHIPINVGHMTLAGVSYFVRDCDFFQITITVPLFIFLLMYVFTSESPKWLLDKNRIDEAVKIMDKIGKFNKTPYPNMKSDMEMYQYMKTGRGETRMNFCKIFSYGHLIRNFFCMAVNYFACGAGYYGVSQYIGKMSGDIHKNVALSGAMLIPGTLIATILLQKLGRRPFLMATNILSGLCMLICVFTPNTLKTLKVVVACCGNCFIFMSFITVFLYGVELFPTSIRNAVLGVLCVLSRVGQIVAPIINRASEMASGLTFGLFAIAAGILCWPLPETKGEELPTTMEDIKKKAAEKNTQKKEPAASSSPKTKKNDAASGSSTSPKKQDAASGSWFFSSSPPPKNKKESTKKKKDETSESWFGGGTTTPKKK